MRVVLTGFMGSGKSTVGRIVADRLGIPLVDLDEEVERRSGLTIRQIFEQRGEAAFRIEERRLLEETLLHDPLILAVGGGTLADREVLDAVREQAVVVWIHPDFSTIVRRIGARGKSDRPLFRDEASTLALYKSRLDSYRRADLTIDVDAAETPDETASRLLLALPRIVCST